MKHHAVVEFSVKTRRSSWTWKSLKIDHTPCRPPGAPVRDVLRHPHKQTPSTSDPEHNEPPNCPAKQCVRLPRDNRSPHDRDQRHRTRQETDQGTRSYHGGDKRLSKHAGPRLWRRSPGSVPKELGKKSDRTSNFLISSLNVRVDTIDAAHTVASCHCSRLEQREDRRAEHLQSGCICTGR